MNFKIKFYFVTLINEVFYFYISYLIKNVVPLKESNIGFDINIHFIFMDRFIGINGIETQE